MQIMNVRGGQRAAERREVFVVRSAEGRRSANERALPSGDVKEGLDRLRSAAQTQLGRPLTSK